MKEKIIEILFFISMISFCIEGSIFITIMGLLVFCSCGIYIISRQEDFILKGEQIPRRKMGKKKIQKNRYNNVA